MVQFQQGGRISSKPVFRSPCKNEKQKKEHKPFKFKAASYQGLE